MLDPLEASELLLGIRVEPFSRVQMFQLLAQLTIEVKARGRPQEEPCRLFVVRFHWVDNYAKWQTERSGK